MHVEDFIACLSVFTKPYLYHAAQLRDFETYIDLGYVAPREELFQRDARTFTPFESDKDDVQNGVGEDCFGNLLDQGRFSKKGNGIPNIYGPITLVFRTEALRNTGAQNITIRRNAIWTRQATHADVLDCEQLRGLYDKWEHARSGEFQIHSGALQLGDLAYVLVNPISIANDKLLSRVETLIKGLQTRSGFPIRVHERFFENDGRDVYATLVEWAKGYEKNAGDYKTLPTALSYRFDSLPHLDSFKAPQLERFANYLDHGTLSRMRDVPGHLTSTAVFASPHVDFEYDEESDFLERVTSLDDDRLMERDRLLNELETSEERLVNARRQREDDETDHVDVAMDNYCDAIANLNYWIEDTRTMITAGIDDVIERYEKGQDLQLTSNISAWAEEFEEVGYPDSGADALNDPLVEWRKVRHYSETCG